ncbi:hypothetical protein CDL12_27116 [Handroanthus impetiginosus]|uniref:Retrotransposon gag domain-containing protein n=1 Tax=Handroanthus impetiginosus TaxID=429701 RepID=A0A2G9G504_9LAMI|nr:hypothetical protein CDL12_27116 [Handroanthus impetiginosus]
MAEGTRSKELSEALKKQEVLLVEEKAQRQAGEKHFQSQLDKITQTQEVLTKRQDTMQITMAEMIKHQMAIQQQMQSIAEQMQQYNKGKSILGERLLASGERASHSRHSFNKQSDDGGSTQSYSSAFPKVELPYFDGEDARGWVRTCNWYFQVISTFPDDQKVPLASVHFQGKAAVWFQNYLEERSLPTWEELVVAVMKRFDDIVPELVIGEFNRLQQLGSVQDYYERFDDVKGKVLMFYKGLDEGYLTGSFISGLKKEIQGSVLASKPKSFQHVVSLAKKFEKSVDALLNSVGGVTKGPGVRSSSRPSQHRNTTLVRRFANPPKPPLPLKVENNPLVRRLLTAAEMKARREKNLCYNCDDLHTPSHRCKQRQIFMMMSEEEEDAYGDEMVSSEVNGEEIMVEEGKVSINAILGNMRDGAIRVDGVVAGKAVQILIDSGSTHSFIDEKLAETLNFEKTYNSPLIVSMADGHKLVSRVTFPHLTWTIHDLSFTHPVKAIKLGGYDMVLGCDMLRKHGPVLLDLENIRCTIKYRGKKIQMQGQTKHASVQLITRKSMSKLLKNGTYGMYGSLCTVTMDQLLKDFNDVFEEPKSLPPKREIEHQIQLIPGATPKKQAP